MMKSVGIVSPCTFHVVSVVVLARQARHHKKLNYLFGKISFQAEFFNKYNLQNKHENRNIKGGASVTTIAKSEIHQNIFRPRI